MSAPKSEEKYLEKLEKAFRLKKPVELHFSRTFENEKEAVTENLGINFARRGRYRDPNFREVKLCFGKKVISTTKAPFSLIRAYYQKKNLSVKRFYCEDKKLKKGVKMDYYLTIHEIVDAD